ncbi:unnamed protein product [Blepharisma stoltei]|uniref:CUE domain-containing protein n=1 Tax=Blepharisma stoltei TaxID=1481888 RepID=A0AAU9IZ01_9CILI|nr:unnamed protein product [Blepharisma stoltei]
MASLRRFLEQREKAKTQPAPLEPITPPSNPLDGYASELKSFFPNEPDDRLKTFVSQFTTKEEADAAVQKIISDGSSIGVYLDDWEQVDNRRKQSNNKRGKKDKSQLNNMPRKSEEVRGYQKKNTPRYRPKVKKPEELEESTEKNTESSDILIEVAKIPEKVEQETENQDKLEEKEEFETIDFPVKVAEQPVETEVKVEVEKIVTPIEEEEPPKEIEENNKNYSVFDEKQAEEFTGKFTARPEVYERITADMENKKTQTPIVRTRDVGIQVTMEGGIPCMIVPLQDRDFFRIENLIYPRS